MFAPQFHIDKQQEIRKILSELSLELPHYTNMHWRLDVQVGSKSLRNTVEPTYLMRIDTESTNGPTSHHIEADFANLQHLHEELERALKASKQPMYRTISRVAK